MFGGFLMRRTSLALAALCSFLAAVPSHAGVCNLDVNPAATLLLPYFEVDLDSTDGSGANTIFSVSSATAEAVLAHVTLYSDLSVPVLDFNLYLTGYDTQVIDLGQLLRTGQFPQYASAGQDPADTISPQGPLSQDLNFANCTGQFPLPTLPPIFISYLRAALTGQPASILGGLCASRDLGDNIARGYVTVDTVNNCTLRFHSDPGYFPATPGGSADITNQNVLWGDYTYTNRGRAEGNTLVHIEADSTNPETSTAGQYTFYGRYVGWNALDNREPLPTTFGARYVTGDTDMIVWRDSKVVTMPFTCPSAAGRPAWFPLGAESIVAFDEQENASLLPTSAVSPSPGGSLVRPFRAEAQRTRVGSNAFPVPYASGWAYMNLNTTVTPAGANPPEDPAAAQAWVTVVTENGRFGVGYDAMRYDNACNASHVAPAF
jgi:hypothetical protein